MANQKIFWVTARAIIERTENGKKEIVIQQGTRHGQNIQEIWELPGGRVEPYESLYDALKREVKEETGIDVTVIQGEDGYFREGAVECLKPYCAYQYLEGFENAIGIPAGLYFICHAEGDILKEGDDTTKVKWIGLEELRRIVDNDKFSPSGKVAAMQYLKDNRSTL